jgi:hypothetical protein
MQRDPTLAGLPLRLPADTEHHALELESGQRLAGGTVDGRRNAARGEEHLADAGKCRQCGHADVVVDRGHVPPAEHLRALDQGVLVQDAGRTGGVGGIPRQEHESGRVRPGGRQLEVDGRPKELVRNLDHHARAVTGVRLGAASAAMIQPAQRRQALGHHIVGPPPGNVDDERDAARVVFVLRLVEAL